MALPVRRPSKLRREAEGLRRKGQKALPLWNRFMGKDKDSQAA
jgi:hypothetical protein